MSANNNNNVETEALRYVDCSTETPENEGYSYPIFWQDQVHEYNQDQEIHLMRFKCREDAHECIVLLQNIINAVEGEIERLNEGVPQWATYQYLATSWQHPYLIDFCSERLRRFVQIWGEYRLPNKVRNMYDTFRIHALHSANLPLIEWSARPIRNNGNPKKLPKDEERINIFLNDYTFRNHHIQDVIFVTTDEEAVIIN